VDKVVQALAAPVVLLVVALIESGLVVVVVAGVLLAVAHPTVLVARLGVVLPLTATPQPSR
jgi:energy-converting hydrogenase Eha subunit C